MGALPLLHFNVVMKCCNLWLLSTVLATCFSSYSGECEPFSCGGGGRQFGYPFERRNNSCGDPLLQLDCDSSSSMPLLDVKGTQYYVRNYTNFSSSPLEGIVITIVDKNLMGEVCDPSSANSTMQFWSSDRLHIVDGYENITLWVGCENDGFKSQKCNFSNNYGEPIGVVCRDIDRISVCKASLFYNTTSDTSWTQICPSQVQLPVRKDFEPESLEPIINEGFKIKWMPSSSCKQCMSDKGICAYRANKTSNPFFCKRRGNDSDIARNPSNNNVVLPGKHRVGGKLKVGVIVGVAVGIGILLIVVVLLTIAFRKRSSSSASKVEKFLQDFIHDMPTRYSYSELKKMTNNFADKLGEGGFGAVYKGKLSKGNLVAVKILDQSKQSESQFMNEVATIGRIHHVHLVRLMGYCFESSRSALLYEYMANGSLEKFVFVKKENPQMVSWEQLYSITLGAARGIAYLHEECERRIIHFDIKPHNILLDADFTPKVSDFGLAKLCGRLDDHVSITATRGTPGYVAPELWCRNLGSITDKADIYSFGMMLLEIVGGRKNIDAQVSRSSEIYFPDWAFKLLENGELEERLRGRIDEENETQVVRMCKVGLWCIQYHSRERPSMSRVVEMLEGKGEEVSNPPFPFNSSASPQRLVMSCSQESSSISHVSGLHVKDM